MKQKSLKEYLKEHLKEHSTEDLPEDLSEDLPEDLSEDLPEDLPEDLTENLTEYLTKTSGTSKKPSPYIKKKICVASPPSLMSDYVFMYSYLVAFFGAILYAINQTINIDPLVIIANKNISMTVNLFIGACGFVSVFRFLRWSIPYLEPKLMNPLVIITETDWNLKY